MLQINAVQVQFNSSNFFVFSLLFPRKSCSLDSRNLKHSLFIPLSKTVVLSSVKQKDSFPVFLKFLSENSSFLRAMQQSLLCTSEPEGPDQPFQGHKLQPVQEIYFSCTWVLSPCFSCITGVLMTPPGAVDPIDSIFLPWAWTCLITVVPLSGHWTVPDLWLPSPDQIQNQKSELASWLDLTFVSSPWTWQMIRTLGWNL